MRKSFIVWRSGHLVILGAGVLAGFVLWSAHASRDVHADTEVLYAQKAGEQYVPETATSFGFSVAGVIEAKDAITVRAQTAGVITEVMAQEGMTVQVGRTLLVQNVPLVEERRALQVAENRLATLSAEAAEIVKNGENEMALVQNSIATTTATLTGERVRANIENNTALLATQLYGSATSLITALDFIDEHKTYFSGRSLNEFREIVGSLYGDSRTYLTGSIQYQLESHDDILTLLNTTTRDAANLDSALLLELAYLIDAELDAARTVLVEGEAEFLDGHVIDQDDPLYAEYFAMRGVVIATQTELRTRAGAIRGTQTSGRLDNLSADGQAWLSGVGRKTAADLLGNATMTTAQSSLVGEAALNVLHSEAALGVSKAPFAGTVENVFVNAGEYVALGEPLMTLVGEGTRELNVTVPATMLPYLSQGNPFVVNARAVGFVAQFVPFVSDGMVSVIIELSEGDWVVGEVLRGEIQLDLTVGEVLGVPRPFVQFDNSGAFVQTESEARIPVEIVYDTGKNFIVRPEKPITGTLIKAVGIAL